MTLQKKNRIFQKDSLNQRQRRFINRNMEKRSQTSKKNNYRNNKKVKSRNKTSNQKKMENIIRSQGVRVKDHKTNDFVQIFHQQQQQYCMNNCEHPKIANGQQTFKFGQIIACVDCQSRLFIIRCPYINCGVAMYQSQPYKMGDLTTCLGCMHTFREVFCKCGNLISSTNPQEQYTRGRTLISCNLCNSTFCHLNCGACYFGIYQQNNLSYETICSQCGQPNIILDCPSCKNSIFPKQLSFESTYKCASQQCKTDFYISRCPFCTGINYRLKAELNHRKCLNTDCQINYYAIKCEKCHEEMYQTEIQREKKIQEVCAKCQFKISLYRCSCDYLNVNNTKLLCLNCKKPFKTIIQPKQSPNPFIGGLFSGLNKTEQKISGLFSTNKNIPPLTFLPPRPVKGLFDFDMTKNPVSLNSPFQNANTKSQQPQKETQKDRNCKSCYDKQADMINIACGHVALCSSCLQAINKKPELKNKCIICKTTGDFKKIFY